MSLKHVVFMSRMRALEAARETSQNLMKKLDEKAEKSAAEKDTKKKAPKGMRRHRLPQ